MLSYPDFIELSRQVRTDRCLWYVVRMLGIPGPRIGQFYPRGTCPYCAKKKAFAMRIGHGWWQCFSCSKSGDAAQLLRDHGPFESILEAMLFLKTHS